MRAQLVRNNSVMVEQISKLKESIGHVREATDKLNEDNEELFKDVADLKAIITAAFQHVPVQGVLPPPPLVSISPLSLSQGASTPTRLGAFGAMCTGWPHFDRVLCALCILTALHPNEHALCADAP